MILKSRGKQGKKMLKPKISKIQVKRVKKSKKENRVKKTRRKVGGDNYKIVVKKPKSIEKNKWIIYALKGCPACENAMKLLDSYNIPYSYVEFEKLNDEKKEIVLKAIDEVQNGFRSFPRIFNGNGMFVGGYSDLEKRKEELLNLKN